MSDRAAILAQLTHKRVHRVSRHEPVAMWGETPAVARHHAAQAAEKRKEEQQHRGESGADADLRRALEQSRKTHARESEPRTQPAHGAPKRRAARREYDTPATEDVRRGYNTRMAVRACMLALDDANRVSADDTLRHFMIAFATANASSDVQLRQMSAGSLEASVADMHVMGALLFGGGGGGGARMRVGADGFVLTGGFLHGTANTSVSALTTPADVAHVADRLARAAAGQPAVCYFPYLLHAGQSGAHWAIVRVEAGAHGRVDFDVIDSMGRHDAAERAAGRPDGLIPGIGDALRAKELRAGVAASITLGVQNDSTQCGPIVMCVLKALCTGEVTTSPLDARSIERVRVYVVGYPHTARPARWNWASRLLYYGAGADRDHAFAFARDHGLMMHASVLLLQCARYLAWVFSADYGAYADAASDAPAPLRRLFGMVRAAIVRAPEGAIAENAATVDMQSSSVTDELAARFGQTDAGTPVVVALTAGFGSAAYSYRLGRVEESAPAGGATRIVTMTRKSYPAALNTTFHRVLPTKQSVSLSMRGGGRCVATLRIPGAPGADGNELSVKRMWYATDSATGTVVPVLLCEWADYDIFWRDDEATASMGPTFESVDLTRNTCAYVYMSHMEKRVNFERLMRDVYGGVNVCAHELDFEVGHMQDVAGRDAGASHEGSADSSSGSDAAVW